MQKRGYTEKEAAVYIGMSPSFLKQDRCYGVVGNRAKGPNFRKIGKKRVIYLKEDLDLWLEMQKSK